MSSIADVVANQVGTPASLSESERVTKNSKELGQEDFFKLLTTQLAAQDPMKPMEDTAFIAQMAQFSSLESQAELNKNFSGFSEAQSFTGAQGMIGKEVTLTSDGKEITGIAEGVEREDGVVHVFIDDGGEGVKGYNIDTVKRVNVEGMIAESPAVIEGDSSAEG